MNKLLLTLLVLLTHSTLSIAQTTRVLIVGDSWASQQIDDGVHNQVFSDNGYANFIVDGSTTARFGSTAAEWVVADQLQLITDALSSQPNIDTVQLTIGGNDFLDDWTASMTAQEETGLQQSILANITTIVNHILAQDPQIEVILSFYDYPNFVDTVSGFTQFFCNNLHQSLGTPSPAVLNTAAQSFEQVYAQLSVNNPRVYHLSHFGLMQSRFGFPPNIQPGDILPPGDISLPSPLESMRVITSDTPDCFHLKAEGYEYLITNLFDGYYHARFDTIFKSGFE